MVTLDVQSSPNDVIPIHCCYPAAMAETTMRAWTHTQIGVPSKVLSLKPDVKKPVLTNPTDVLVRITHASLSPGASLMMQFAPFIFRHTPAIPEVDFSGTVVAVGSSVPESRNLSAGDAVFGSITLGPHLKRGAGALAEYVVVDHTGVVRTPDGMDAGEAAGLGVSGCTALVLVRAAELKAGERVLVYGASGGVGGFVVQMCKNAVGEEGKVVCVCSGRSEEAVRGLGADEIIDYTAHSSLPAYLKSHHSSPPFTSIIDAHGSSDLYLNSSDYLAPEGSYVTVGVAHSDYTVPSMLYAVYSMLWNAWVPHWLGGGERRYVNANVTANLEMLEELGRLVREGKIRVLVDSRWDGRDALKAYERLRGRHARGKIIVKISPDSL
ncbi:hypothetical protein FGG08_001146 [Glutinoglossum americanum]|uniref:Enoyl reductase (ER) domain-containing protein n=1 Tax=Glutinoglossum americanum TaxID=1670608 RepID=A0A9P8I7P1_9PEZI|nr:hypothetical protein FGG08_001146 [Glutinoglossum americanum]